MYIVFPFSKRNLFLHDSCLVFLSLCFNQDHVSKTIIAVRQRIFPTSTRCLPHDFQLFLSFFYCRVFILNDFFHQFIYIFNNIFSINQGTYGKNGSHGYATSQIPAPPPPHLPYHSHVSFSPMLLLIRYKHYNPRNIFM